MRRLLLAGLVLAAAVSADAQSFEIEKVVDGVYAAIPRPGLPVGSNGAFIIGEEEVIVVDTHYRPSFARELLGEIKKITPTPVRYVINTHWHNDHVQGNQAYFNAYPEGVELLSHHATREDIIDKAIPSMKKSLESLPGEIAELEQKLSTLQGEELTRARRRLEQQKAYLAELKKIEITLPTLTFERSAILHEKNREIRLLYFGRGHTRGDVVTYLPAEKVAIVGDLLTSGVPFARDGYPAEWAETLSQVAKLDIDKVIPGHGGVFTGKQVIDDRIRFLEEIVSQVKKGLSEGKTPEQIKSSVDVSRFESTFAPDPEGRPLREWPAMGTLLDRAIAEARGQLK